MLSSVDKFGGCHVAVTFASPGPFPVVTSSTLFDCINDPIALKPEARAKEIKERPSRHFLAWFRTKYGLQ